MLGSKPGGLNAVMRNLAFFLMVNVVVEEF